MTKPGTTARTNAPKALAQTRALFEPALRRSLTLLTDERVRRVAGYQLGLWDADGTPEADSARSGGKAVRPALVLLAAAAVGGSPEPGIPAAVSVELVHNFSLLHDDIMDRDVERRHRPTGWVVFGEGQAILAGNAMMGAAFDVLVRDCPHAEHTVPLLLRTVQQLISGQSADLALEGDDTAGLADVVAMEEGKTAALIASSLALGALAAGAPGDVADRLASAGHKVGIAFQLVDDVLGITGDPAVTGKSASSDVRAGKRSAPVVAALRSGGTASAELAAELAGGPPSADEHVARVVALIEAAGGVTWATSEAERLLDEALQTLDDLADEGLPTAELRGVAEFLVRRDR